MSRLLVILAGMVIFLTQAPAQDYKWKTVPVDGKITEDECKDLRQWLYDNINLSGHFPFNKTMEME